MRTRAFRAAVPLVALLAIASSSACAVEPSDDASLDDPASLARTQGWRPPIYAAPSHVLEVGPRGVLVRISSTELDSALSAALLNTRLVIDTTGKSSTIPSDPFYHCWYPNAEIRNALIVECMDLPTSARATCLKSVNLEYPNVKHCDWTTGPVHSYVDFGGAAEAMGAKDVPFEGIAQISRNSWGPGGVKIDINNVNVTLGLSTFRAAFTPDSVARPSATISLDLTSNQPTLPCDHSVFACPDIELTNMKLETQLTDIRPDPADPTRLAYDSVWASFSFSRNLNNIPDWLVTPLLDVDGIIRNNVQNNVQRALKRATSREALGKALTELATRAAKTKNGSSGIARFYETRLESYNTLVVDYEPCPSSGCAAAITRTFAALE